MHPNNQWFKNEPFGAFWEKGYRNSNVSCMGGPSFEVAEILPLLPKKAKVLDLGCGEGRNALFLAGQGCLVTAVDRSASGIKKLLAISEKNCIPLTAVVQDIIEFPLEEEYDLIMGHGVLYYLENATWRKLLTRIKKHTKSGGFNIFTLFVYNEKYPCVEEIQAAQYKNSFLPNELQEFYQDWIEHRYDRYVKWDAHPGIPLHYHPIEKLVSQKPLKKIEKVFIDSGKDLLEDDFHAISIGISQDELIKRVGHPSIIESMSMHGVQFGISRVQELGGEEDRATTEGYRLELWYYGKYLFYIANGEVAGRALYSTKPMRLKFEEKD
ncbi:MAG: methyltransferase domain-containing protein [Chlamydiales bacterium]